MPTPEIRTTVVGSYPLPDWLVASPSQQALIDATRVVFKTQEELGIDVVADGELYRFDINHPDTNGMIEYFIRPMSGIRSAVTRGDIEEFGKLPGMGFRAEPAGVVEGPIDEGTLNLPRDYRRARSLTSHAMKFTLTGPHMLCKTLMDHHYKSKAELAMALGQALAKQVRSIHPQVIQIDEANIPGHPDEGDWAADAINVVLDAAGAEPSREVAARIRVSELKGRPIGRVLVKMGRATREQIVEGLVIQKQKGGPLGQILIDLGYVYERDLALALAGQRGMESIAQSEMTSVGTVEVLHRSQVEKGVHICFGNYGGQSIQKGEWKKLINFMNKLHCDHVVLEFAFRGYDELVHFRDMLDPRIAIGLGVIDIKVNTVETPEVVASRIEQATQIVGPGRIKWVHPDCGFWMNKRSIADRKMASLVQGRDLFLGRR